MFVLTIGKPGQGKSLDNADTLLWLLWRNKRIEKKYGMRRLVLINFHVSDKILSKYKDFIRYWNDPMQLVKMRDCDIVWDEISVALPSDKWKDTPPAVRHMLAQHRKRGIEIHANTQDFRMLDINARRMIHRVFLVKKVLGSRDISATKPKLRYIWGLILKFELDPMSLEDGAVRKIISWFPSIILISRSLVSVYDTTEDIKPPPEAALVHFTRKCYTCGYVKEGHH